AGTAAAAESPQPRRRLLTSTNTHVAPSRQTRSISPSANLTFRSTIVSPCRVSHAAAASSELRPSPRRGSGMGRVYACTGQDGSVPESRRSAGADATRSRRGTAAVDVDDVRALLLGEDPRQRIEAALGDGVGTVHRGEALGHVRGEIDDVAALALPHVREHRLDQVKWTAQVDSKNALPVLARKLGDP